ncbi:MAG: acyl-CoA dehydratase activase [Smithellaceae bacterium]
MKKNMKTDYVAVAGVDIGSLTAKTVILDLESNIIACNVIREGMVDQEAAGKSLKRALADAHLKQGQLAAMVTTGYGRSMVKFADVGRNVTEITCHARGMHFVIPEARTIIDMGGQDTKAIRLNDKGDVVNFIMNDKCAAGTGRFLEVMAGALKVKLEDMGSLSLQSDNPEQISSVCTVFAESEVISLVAQGHLKKDIIAGIHIAVTHRVAGMARNVGVQPPVAMSGGVAKNRGIVKELENAMKTQVMVPSDPQIIGALGAALFALDDFKAVKAVKAEPPFPNPVRSDNNSKEENTLCSVCSQST